MRQTGSTLTHLQTTRLVKMAEIEKQSSYLRKRQLFNEDWTDSAMSVSNSALLAQDLLVRIRSRLFHLKDTAARYYMVDGSLLRTFVDLQLATFRQCLRTIKKTFGNFRGPLDNSRKVV